MGYPRWLAINPSVGSKGDAYDNGKAERFIRTRLELWAYAYPYVDERQRTIALAPVLDSYNRLRRHRALGGPTPLQRVNNLSGTDT